MAKISNKNCPESCSPARLEGLIKEKPLSKGGLSRLLDKVEVEFCYGGFKRACGYKYKLPKKEKWKVVIDTKGVKKEEQKKTLVHEFAHIYYETQGLVCPMLTGEGEESSCDNLIESEAVRFYRKAGRFVDWLLVYCKKEVGGKQKI